MAHWPRLVLIVFLALLAAVPLAAPQFWVTLGNYIGLYSMVALGLVLLTGVAGQTSFGPPRSPRCGRHAIFSTRVRAGPCARSKAASTWWRRSAWTRRD